MDQGNVKVSFTLLNWIHNSRLSKNPPFPPFEKGGNRKSPFVKGDLEGFSSAQHDFDETMAFFFRRLTTRYATQPGTQT